MRAVRNLLAIWTVAVACILAASPLRSEEPVPNVVVFGGDGIYPPYEWAEGGEPTGFNVDLSKALAEVGGVGVEHRLGDWPDTIRALESGAVDVVPMFISEERQRKFRFTRPFQFVSHAIYAGPDEAAVSLDDLEGASVAVERQSYAHQRLQIGRSVPTLVLTGNTLEALEAVAEGRARYAVLAIPTADRLIQLRGLGLRQAGPPFWPQGYAFAVRADRAELADWLNQSLTLAIGTGRYEEVYERWKERLQPADISLGSVLVPAGTVAAALLLLIALGFGWSMSLRKLVSKRTAQLNEELRRNEEAKHDIQYLADYDVDTGLPKRHHFLSAADEIIGEQPEARLEVVLLGLVGMENIIGSFGYEVCEKFVAAFAERVSGSGSLASGYLGRGVFVLIAARSSVSEHLDELTEHVEIGELALYPQLVTGVAHSPDHGETAAELIRRAETALASSVAHSRGQTVYDFAIEPDRRDIEIVGAFRERNGAGLRAFLQPQVDLRTGEIVAAEALIRWQDADLGEISPAKFVPLLERAGLIGSVTAFMIDEAARMAASLRRLRRPCVVSVNVSANDLLTTDLCALVADAVERNGIRPRDIKLELTETSAAQDPDRVRSVLAALNAMGVKTSIDDFGTGYSSLIYLSTFPVSEVKIDRAFVRDMVVNAKNNSIVRSTVSVAQDLGLTVVAEGAEDAETMAALAAIGCDLVQGYFVSRPLPEDEFVAFVRHHGSKELLAALPN